MSDDVELRMTVLRVLDGQSPDYFIFPNAAAFAAEGLDHDDVARVLDELLVEGVLERELIFVIERHSEANGKTGMSEPIPGGYRLVREEQT